MLWLKAEREAAQRAEEEAFRQSMMAKFAEDDRLEQLNAQKRRLKVRGAGCCRSFGYGCRCMVMSSTACMGALLGEGCCCAYGILFCENKLGS
jgi:hypothetical protein